MENGLGEQLCGRNRGQDLMRAPVRAVVIGDRFGKSSGEQEKPDLVTGGCEEMRKTC